MSGSTDPFLVLVDDIGALRRQIENLQRTSLDRDEAETFNVRVAEVLNSLAEVAPALQKVMQRDLAQAALDVRRHAVEAAQSAARGNREIPRRASRPRKTSHGPQERPAERRGAGLAGSGSGWSRSGPQGRLSAHWRCSGSKAAPMPTSSESIPASTALPQVDALSISQMEADTASS